MPSPRHSRTLKSKTLKSLKTKSLKRSLKRSLKKRSLKRSIKKSKTLRSKSIKKSKTLGSKSPKNGKTGEKTKFYDLVGKKTFFTSDYKIVSKIVHGKNGKRKVTYYVTDNPTPRKDGTTFKNWKILSNTKA